VEEGLIITEYLMMHRLTDVIVVNKKSRANAKGNAQQWCMFEGPLRTKSKLTDLSN